MEHIAIDLHKRDSQIYILARGGEVIEQRIRTEPERFAAVLGARPRARILIEASTDDVISQTRTPARGPDGTAPMTAALTATPPTAMARVLRPSPAPSRPIPSARSWSCAGSCRRQNP